MGSYLEKTEVDLSRGTLSELALANLALLSLGLLGLLDGSLLLSQDELDVGGVGHVGVDTAVSAVGSSALLGGTVHLDVVNVQGLGVKALNLGVRLGVLEEVNNELARLLGPTSLGGAVVLALSLTADTAEVHAEGDDVLVGDNVVHVALSSAEHQALDGVGSLNGVLEGKKEINKTRTDRVRREPISFH